MTLNGQVQIIKGGIGFENTDVSKIFGAGRRSDYGTYATITNSTYTDTYIPAGTVVGRATSGANAGLIVPFTSGATDGSQFVVGILMNDIYVPAGATITGQQVYYVNEGDVFTNMLVLQGSDTLQTICANGRTVWDKIGAEAVAIKLVRTEQMTDFNNSGS
jgi:hypothetical protein